MQFSRKKRNRRRKRASGCEDNSKEVCVVVGGQWGGNHRGSPGWLVSRRLLDCSLACSDLDGRDVGAGTGGSAVEKQKGR